MIKNKISFFSQNTLYENIVTVVFLIILCQTIPGTFFGNSSLSTIMIFAGFGLGFVFFAYESFKKGLPYFETITIVLIFCCQLLSSLVSGNSEITGVVLGLRYFFIAYLAVRIKLNYKIINFVYYLFYAYIVYMLSSGVSVRDLVQDVSYNSITVIGVSLLSLSYIAASQNGRGIQIFPSLLLLFTSIWAATRIGVIIGAFLIISVLFLGESSKEKKLKRLKILFTVIAACVIGIYILSKTNKWDSFLFQITYKTEHAGSLMDDVRWRVIAEYFDGCFSNPIYLLFGGTYKEFPIIHSLADNPHNMFVSLHANYGLIGFVAVMGMLIKTGIYMLRNNRLHFIILVVIFMSGFGNICGFPGLYDALTFYLIFNAFRKQGAYKSSDLNNYERNMVRNNC